MEPGLLPKKKMHVLRHLLNEMKNNFADRQKGAINQRAFSTLAWQHEKI